MSSQGVEENIIRVAGKTVGLLALVAFAYRGLIHSIYFFCCAAR